MNLHPKLITSTAKAEIISIELTLPNKKRLTVSTLYRVGTLGNFNANEVASHFTNIFSSKKYKYNFIVGDMNLDTVNWLSNSTSKRVHTSFISLFNDLGLSQLIHEATHKGGKILDALLCDSLDIIRNLKVELPGTFVNSDHSPITFTINAIVQIQIQIQIQILQSRRLVGPRPILALPIYHSFVPGLTVACSEG